VRDRYDVVVVGGGHNGLAAAAYLARAGRSVLVLERARTLGGATASAEAFPGHDVTLSRYSYLVSLLPSQIVRELGLDVRLRPRRVSSYSTSGAHPGRGLLVDAGPSERTAASFRSLTGSDAEHVRWQRLYARLEGLARAVFPTMTAPLPTRSALRRRVADDATWEAVVQRPLGELLESALGDDLARGAALTDGLIGTFAAASDASLRQNRCFLYHVIGGGTGRWDVPVGGMGALSGALATAAGAAGADLVPRAAVTRVETAGPGEGPSQGAEVAFVLDGVERTVAAGHVVAAVAPAVLDRLLGREPSRAAPEGAQLKVNLLLSRLPRLASGVAAEDAFAGTLHVDEGYADLEAAYRQAEAGRLPDRVPFEVYCHTLTDRSILGPEAAGKGWHTLTVFALHTPARLFPPDGSSDLRAEATARVLAGLDAVLAEPLAGCLVTGEDGHPCVEAKTPLDLEAELGLPGGHIFHRDLQWPFVDDDDPRAGCWGVETDDPAVLLAGAGALRGGGVSGIPGRNAAVALLEGPRRAG